MKINQPNQSGKDFNISKTSFSVETANAFTGKEEYRQDCRADYVEVKVIYKDDLRSQMLQNLMSGKIMPSTQVSPQVNVGARRDLFRYNKFNY